MRKLNVIRNIFRGLLLCSLIFRSFFLKDINYTWNIITYLLLAFAIVGLISLEIMLFIKKKKSS
jgi:hypothetical protein